VGADARAGKRDRIGGGHEDPGWNLDRAGVLPHGGAEEHLRRERPCRPQKLAEEIRRELPDRKNATRHGFKVTSS
jgi:hypothetical protein